MHCTENGSYNLFDIIRQKFDNPIYKTGMCLEESWVCFFLAFLKIVVFFPAGTSRSSAGTCLVLGICPIGDHDTLPL